MVPLKPLFDNNLLLLSFQILQKHYVIPVSLDYQHSAVLMGKITKGGYSSKVTMQLFLYTGRMIIIILIHEMFQAVTCCSIIIFMLQIGLLTIKYDGHKYGGFLSGSDLTGSVTVDVKAELTIKGTIYLHLRLLLPAYLLTLQ